MSLLRCIAASGTNNSAEVATIHAQRLAVFPFHPRGQLGLNAFRAPIQMLGQLLAPRLRLAPSTPHQVLGNDRLVRRGRDDHQVRQNGFVFAEAQTLLPGCLLPSFAPTTVQLMQQTLDGQLQFIPFLTQLLLSCPKAHACLDQFLIHPL
jgi:hypothetical protein